jgi:hypothetical protein
MFDRWLPASSRWQIAHCLTPETFPPWSRKTARRPAQSSTKWASQFTSIETIRNISKLHKESGGMKNFNNPQAALVKKHSDVRKGTAKLCYTEVLFRFFVHSEDA